MLENDNVHLKFMFFFPPGMERILHALTSHIFNRMWTQWTWTRRKLTLAPSTAGFGRIILLAPRSRARISTIKTTHERIEFRILGASNQGTGALFRVLKVPRSRCASVKVKRKIDAFLVEGCSLRCIGVHSGLMTKAGLVCKTPGTVLGLGVFSACHLDWENCVLNMQRIRETLTWASQGGW